MTEHFPSTEELRAQRERKEREEREEAEDAKRREKEQRRLEAARAEANLKIVEEFIEKARALRLRNPPKERVRTGYGGNYTVPAGFRVGGDYTLNLLVLRNGFRRSHWRYSERGIWKKVALEDAPFLRRIAPDQLRKVLLSHLGTG